VVNRFDSGTHKQEFSIMLKSRGLFAATALVAVLAFGAGLSSAEAAGGSPAKGAQTTKSARITTNRLKLLNSRVSFDNNLVALGAGFQPIDAVTNLVCPANASLGCVITAEQNVQVRTNLAGNDWAICTRVNGVDMNAPFCPFLGQIPVNIFSASSFEQSHRVNPGTVNNLQTFLFTDLGADRSIYEIHYEIHKILP
jgi:hypothetical protein